MSNNRHSVLFLVSVTLLAMSPGLRADWPQFRGPQGRGIAVDNQPLPTRFGPKQNVKWRVRITHGHSSPCIVGDRIFLTGFDKSTNQLETTCLDRTSGRILWRRSAPARTIEKVHRISSPAASTPVADAERVYVYFGSFGLICYDHSGEKLWSRKFPQPNVYFGAAVSPILAGKSLIFNSDHQGMSSLSAIDPRTGRTRWQVARPEFQRGWSTPVHVRHAGRNTIVIMGGGRLVGYDLENGNEQWWVNGMPPFPISTPVAVNGRLYVTAADEFGDSQNLVPPPAFAQFSKAHDKNMDGRIARGEIPEKLIVIKRGAGDGAGDVTLKGWFFGTVDKNKDGSLSQKEWDQLIERFNNWPGRFKVMVMSIALGGKDDITDKQVLWQHKRGVPEVPSPLCYRGRLYTIKNGGILHCRDTSSGRLIYRRRVGAGGGYYASPVAGDGKIYIASDRGMLVVFQAGDSFKLLARNDLGEPLLATPALVEGTVFVRTATQLFAFSR